MDFEKYNKGKQPCQDFEPDEIEFAPWGWLEHDCPKCGKKRMFCGECHYDHHENGWETCEEPVNYATDTREKYKASVETAQ